MVDDKLRDEAGRIAALERARVLDTGREESFEKITRLVRAVLRVPIAAVSLIDRDRQWFKAIDGLSVTETPRSVAFCAHTILQRSPLVIEDATKDPRFVSNPLVTGAPRIRSYAGVPLNTVEGYNLGSLCAIDTSPRLFKPEELELLKNFAMLVVDEIELRTVAQRDHLTGALTRRAFAEAAAQELERSRRYRRPMSLVLFDLDHFKNINDSWGHPFGDEVLSKVAEAVRRIFRPADIFARYGGEEFVLLLPETGEEQALLCADRIRQIIRSIGLSQPTQVTASFGVSTLHTETEFLATLIAAADAALYASKRLGRDRCSSASALQQAA